MWDHDAEDEREWDVDTDESDALPKMQVPADKPRRGRRFGRHRRKRVPGAVPKT